MAGIPLMRNTGGTTGGIPLALPDIARIEMTHIDWLSYWSLLDTDKDMIDLEYDRLPTQLKLEQEMVFGVQMKDNLCM